MNKLLIACLLIPSVALAEPKATASQQIGGWHVAQYYEDGVYTHCVMATTYTAQNSSQRREMRADNVHLMFKINKDNMLIVTLVSDEWKLSVGEKYVLRFVFPGGEWHSLTGESDRAEGMSYVLDMTKSSSEFFALISKSDKVNISINDKSLGNFNLQKSRAAMDALLDCHGKNIDADHTPDPSFEDNGPTF